MTLNGKSFTRIPIDFDKMPRNENSGGIQKNIVN